MLFKRLFSTQAPSQPAVPEALPCGEGPPVLGLIAGEGLLPVYVAKTAKQLGYRVEAFPIYRSNRHALAPHCEGVTPISPGLIDRNIALWRSRGATHLVFAGKVNKWLLFTNLQLDARGLDWLRRATLKNDDNIMRFIITEFEAEGFTILPQTQFLESLFEPDGVLTQSHPTQLNWDDIALGYQLAKEMGRLDIGQTVVIKDTMVLAVEAIEGTDECLKRAGKLARGKGGVVVKVAKPEQDQRFDVPTVGVRTLKTMRAHGLQVLATEANSTLFLDRDAMIAYANTHGLCLVSYVPHQWPWGPSLIERIHQQAHPNTSHPSDNQPIGPTLLALDADHV
jgi:UDP-2,3-diacylglucosamine hydrolase